VDDHALFRGGLRTVLEDHGVHVVGEAGDGERGVELAAELAPDVVAMDLHMPGIGGVEATRRIVALGGPTRVLVLTISSDERAIAEAMRAGATACVIKDAPVDELAAAVVAAARPSA
jgi:DNA-binding NarL/FixJ family response regulator